VTDVCRLPGLADYADTHALQQRLVDQRLRAEIPDTLLFLEHAPVFTVGRAKGARGNVLDAGETPVIDVERGGDVTWHGPGQLVVYPIVDLRGRREDLRLHMSSLEQAVIELLRGLGLDPRRDPRNTGVWLPCADGQVRKVCSVGIACRRWVTWHGLALNVDPDPAWFARIHPCGFEASVMTRLADHLDSPPSIDALVDPLAEHLLDALDLR
jgi:lipoyl(octanoyl) transferase